ncbi:MAG: hypothetical protein WD342_05280 [Verrucomicrobiales bacterium]
MKPASSQAILLFPALAMFHLFLWTPSLAQDDEFRLFTSADGRTIQAKAVSSSGDAIKIKMKDGRTFDLPIENLSPGDQEWIAEWKKEKAREYVPDLKISFDENLEKSTDESGFVHIESFSPELSIENRERSFDLSDAKVTTLLIVEDVEKEGTFAVLSKETVTLSLPAGESRKLEGKKTETKHATVRSYGAKYSGHSVVVENSSGKVIAHQGSRGWNKNPENALEAQEGSTVQKDFAARE